MSTLNQIFSMSVLRKYVMALTGLFLCSFLVEHLIGNLMLYKADEGMAYEAYSKFMAGNMIIRVVEIVLFLAVIFHVVDAIILTSQNKKARGAVGYEVSKASKNSTWYSRNMGLTGSIILVFLVVHLKSFFVAFRILDPGDMTMYGAVKAHFHEAWYAGLYLVSMVLLGAHLNHGLQSAFQSLGLNNKKYAPILKTIGTWFAILITIGFASFPIAFYFNIVQ